MVSNYPLASYSLQDLQKKILCRICEIWAIPWKTKILGGLI